MCVRCSYPGADVVLLCFSTVNRASFNAIKEKVRKHIHTHSTLHTRTRSHAPSHLYLCIPSSPSSHHPFTSDEAKASVQSKHKIKLFIHANTSFFFYFQHFDIFYYYYFPLSLFLMCTFSHSLISIYFFSAVVPRGTSLHPKGAGHLGRHEDGLPRIEASRSEFGSLRSRYARYGMSYILNML